MNQYLIMRRGTGVLSCLKKDGHAVEIHMDPLENPHGIGDIYIGRIKNVAWNLNAAFVEIAPQETCYLALEEMKQPIFTKKGPSPRPQAGDELLVQITREPIKTKAAAVTAGVSLPGRYLVLCAGKEGISVSSRLEKQQREHLRETLSRIAAQAPAPVKCSWIVRTNAGAASDEQLYTEFYGLCEKYQAICDAAPYRSCYSCLYKKAPAWIGRLTDLYESDNCEIITDDPDLYGRLQEWLSIHQKEDLARLRLYKDRLLPMDKLYSIDHELSGALDERVWLKSGGYLVIQPTEALTVIDVNSGKFEGGKQKRETVRKINLEAAREAARQMRLRNLSGIIVVDFINQDEPEDVEELMQMLNACVKQDPVRTTVVDRTRLHLVEITRRKKEKSLAEALREA